MERLSPSDSAFWRGENRQTHMQLATVAILEGPAPDYGQFSQRVERLLNLAPRYRQRVVSVPMNLQREVWADDAHFRLDYHLRHTALPTPGGHDQLRALLGRVMAQQLDRAKPLWELWVVEGLEQNRWAIILKAHLCLVNGLDGQDLTELLLDDDIEAQEFTWLPGEDPNSRQLLIEAATDLAISPLEQIQAARSAIRLPANAFKQGLALGLGTRPSAERSGLVAGPVGPHRSCEWIDLSLTDLRQLGRRHEVPVLVIILNLLSAGLRSGQAHDGRLAHTRSMRALVPLLASTSLENGGLRVYPAQFELPIGEPESARRLQEIQRQLNKQQTGEPAIGAKEILSLRGFAAARLLAVGLRSITRRAQRGEQADTTATYVLGPNSALQCMGRSVSSLYPYAPLGERQRIAFAIYSYCEMVSITITVDRDREPLLEPISKGIDHELKSLAAT